MASSRSKRLTPGPEPEMYQNCLITLSDGTKHVFTGKAFSSGMEDEVRKITCIQFTLPQPLPFGYYFNESLLHPKKKKRGK